MRTIAGHLLLPGENDACETRPGCIQFDAEEILEVELFSDPETRLDETADNTLICPGFIDAHLHLPQFDSIGAAGMPLLPWLNEVIFPAEIRWNDLDYSQGMIERVIRQCAAVGTTALCAYSTVSYPATIAALEAFRAKGFRGRHRSGSDGLRSASAAFATRHSVG